MVGSTGDDAKSSTSQVVSPSSRYTSQGSPELYAIDRGEFSGNLSVDARTAVEGLGSLSLRRVAFLGAKLPDTSGRRLRTRRFIPRHRDEVSGPGFSAAVLATRLIGVLVGFHMIGRAAALPRFMKPRLLSNFSDTAEGVTRRCVGEKLWCARQDYAV